jgi:hypothetical protein
VAAVCSELCLFKYRNVTERTVLIGSNGEERERERDMKRIRERKKERGKI